MTWKKVLQQKTVTQKKNYAGRFSDAGRRQVAMGWECENAAVENRGRARRPVSITQSGCWHIERYPAVPFLER
jgi:hypothetical protein